LCASDSVESWTAEHLLATARQRLVGVPERSGGGLFLGNGGRIYLDAGSHPEFATPECADPWEVLRYVRAGERIISELAQATTQESRGITSIDVFRCNVDYASPKVSWGCHESYLHRSDPNDMPAMLLPHLVSRIIYTGAGGFDQASRGIRFTLSPRALLFERAVSDNSTNDRGIYHTRNETLSRDGYNRLHLICGESLCSDSALLLKLGTTALIVAAIDAGSPMGSELRLESPVAALRAIAGDSSCRRRVTFADGRLVSAIDLQRHYLERVEACLAAGALPDWAPEICRRWRATLDSLEREAVGVRAELDWGMKRLLFHRRLREYPEWRELERGVVSSGRDARGRRGPTAAFRALRQEMFEADVRFGQLGDQGIFTQLERAGKVGTRLVASAEVDRAMTEPPSRGRAHTRGKWIQQVYRAGAAREAGCSWSQLWNHSDALVMDLSDPFAESGSWRPMHERRGPPPGAGNQQELFDRHFAMLENLF
jgi:proteasome accessory factor A